MTTVTISSFAIVLLAACIHATFQLSVSVLTLLSGHSIGKQTAHKKVLRLMCSFTSGALFITLLVIGSLSYYLDMFVHQNTNTEQLFAIASSGLMAGLGVITWAFYYRKGRGTSLWLPRGFANYLTKRTKRTSSRAEGFALGMTSVVAELIFIVTPALAASLAIITLPDLPLRLTATALYVFISILPLLIIIGLVGSGANIAHCQQWRESHKHFLQFVSGGSLLVLAGFLFVDRVIGVVSYGGSLW